MAEALPWRSGSRDVDTTCTRVGLVPTGANEFPFSRYDLWFQRDDLLLTRVDLYGRDHDERIETVTCTGYAPRGAVQTPHACEISHVRTKARAVIIIENASHDSGPADDLFTVSGLDHGP